MVDLQKFRSIPINNLIDIRDIKINLELEKKDKIIDYITQIKNPYCYKYKDYRVLVCFNKNEDAKTLEETLSAYIENL